MEGRNIEAESKPKSFEEQFANRQQIESLGRKIEVVDITPENQKTDESFLRFICVICHL